MPSFRLNLHILPPLFLNFYVFFTSSTKYYYACLIKVHNLLFMEIILFCFLLRPAGVTQFKFNLQSIYRFELATFYWTLS